MLAYRSTLLLLPENECALAVKKSRERTTAPAHLNPGIPVLPPVAHAVSFGLWRRNGFGNPVQGTRKPFPEAGEVVYSCVRRQASASKVQSADQTKG